jgi:hypothetical protein
MARREPAFLGTGLNFYHATGDVSSILLTYFCGISLKLFYGNRKLLQLSGL